MVFRPLFLTVLILASAQAPSGARVDAVPAFAHLEKSWNAIDDYSMTIDAHEVLGTDSADSELHYAFKRPNRARLDVLAGPNSGATVFLDGASDTVTAYQRAFPLFRKHGTVHDKDLTSLRGVGILMSNIGDLVACFDAHRDELRQIDGPSIDGEPTDEIVLPYARVACPDDPPNDRGSVTLDVIDIARDTGLVMLRKRYVGDEVVERYAISSYKINSGLGEDDLT